MTKQLILTFAVFCTLQARANVQPVQEDTVRHYSRYEARELLQFMQPAYLDGVVLPMSRTGNWFVSIAGGMTAFLGTPLGCEDLFGRVKPSYSFAVGKWFTPSVGTHETRNMDTSLHHPSDGPVSNSRNNLPPRVFLLSGLIDDNRLISGVCIPIAQQYIVWMKCENTGYSWSELGPFT